MKEARPIFKGARSWQELHRELEAKGMKYERTESGGKVRVGGEDVYLMYAPRSYGYQYLILWHKFPIPLFHNQEDISDL